MREIYRLSVGGILFSCVAVFVFLPLFIRILGFEDIIYSRGYISNSLMLLNCFSLSPLLFVYLWLGKGRDALLQNNKHISPNGWLPLWIIAVWCVVFIMTGGLEYRNADVIYGYLSRSTLLQLSLSLTNVIVILAASAVLPMRHSGILKVSSYVCIFSLAACLVVSGSRGTFAQLVLTIWISRHLAFTMGNDSVTNLANHKLASVKHPSLITPKSLLSIIAFIAALGFWGSFRDNQQNVMFGMLFRAAEPYWHDAYIKYMMVGSDPSILSDSLERIVSIPGRWLGFVYGSSIDGAEQILQEKLGIAFIEGISLPITFFGEGILMAGHWGATLFVILVIIMVLVSTYLIWKLPIRSRPVFISILAFQIVKCLFLYPKSLSGVFLVLFYETARDSLILLLLTFPFTYRAHIK